VSQPIKTEKTEAEKLLLNMALTHHNTPILKKQRMVTKQTNKADQKNKQKKLMHLAHDNDGDATTHSVGDVRSTNVVRAFKNPKISCCSCSAFSGTLCLCHSW
jgi:hypothetical protein